MKNVKRLLFLIVCLITVGFGDNKVFAVPSTNPTVPDEPSASVTRCVYSGTLSNENFTVTYSVQPNNKGSAKINWVESSHSRIQILNSYVYGKEFVTNGDTITCPKYLYFKVDSTGNYMNVKFREKYSQKLELSSASTNNNKKFSKSNVSIVNTCSYDDSFAGRLYVESYSDGTISTHLSTQNVKETSLKLFVDGVGSDLFKKSCPKLGIGSDIYWRGNSHDSVAVIYVMKDAFDFEVKHDGYPLNINMELKEGSKLKKDGDDIKKSQAANVGNCCVYKNINNNNKLYAFNASYIKQSSNNFFVCLSGNCESSIYEGNSTGKWKKYIENIDDCSKMPSGIITYKDKNGNLGYLPGTEDEIEDIIEDIISMGIDLQRNSYDFYELFSSSTCPADLYGEAGLDFEDQIEVTCDGILGQEFLDFVNKIFRWIQIIAPIFVVIMGSVDFAGAVLQDDRDAMKKASSKFIKRVLIAVAIFFIPLILEFMLNIFNEFSKHNATICGIRGGE